MRHVRQIRMCSSVKHRPGCWMRDSVCEHGIHGRSGIQSAFRRVTHQRPRRRRVYFGPYRNNPDNNGMHQIVTIPPIPWERCCECESRDITRLDPTLRRGVQVATFTVYSPQRHGHRLLPVNHRVIKPVSSDLACSSLLSNSAVDVSVITQSCWAPNCRELSSFLPVEQSSLYRGLLTTAEFRATCSRDVVRCYVTSPWRHHRWHCPCWHCCVSVSLSLRLMEVSPSVCLCGQWAGAARYDTIRDASQSALSTARYQLLNVQKTEEKNFVVFKKKLCYRRETARRDVSVEFLPAAASQCRYNLYDKSRTNRSNGLRGLHSRPTCNKLVHSATTRFTVVV